MAVPQMTETHKMIDLVEKKYSHYINKKGKLTVDRDTAVGDLLVVVNLARNLTNAIEHLLGMIDELTLDDTTPPGA